METGYIDQMLAPDLERIADFNRTNRDFPDQVTLHEVVEARVQEHPLRLAVLCDHDKFWGTAALNYGQVNEGCTLVARTRSSAGTDCRHHGGAVIRHDHRHLWNHEGRCSLPAAVTR